MELFKTSVGSPVLITLTVVYIIAAAITTFDIRIIQGKKSGILPWNQKMLPAWTGMFGWLLWLTWAAVFLLNWWYALLLFALKFIFKLLPVLETMGCYILLPILGKNRTTEPLALILHQITEQQEAGNTLHKVTNTKNPDEALAALRQWSAKHPESHDE